MGAWDHKDKASNLFDQHQSELKNPNRKKALRSAMDHHIKEAGNKKNISSNKKKEGNEGNWMRDIGTSGEARHTKKSAIDKFVDNELKK